MLTPPSLLANTLGKPGVSIAKFPHRNQYENVSLGKISPGGDQISESHPDLSG